MKAKRGEAQEFEAFQNIEDENGNNSSRNSRKKSLDDEDLGLEKAKNETKRRKKDVSEEDTSAKKKKKKANWWEEEEAKEKSTLGEDSKDNNNNNNDDDDASDDQMENEDVDFTFSAKNTWWIQLDEDLLAVNSLLNSVKKQLNNQKQISRMLRSS